MKKKTTLQISVVAWGSAVFGIVGLLMATHSMTFSPGRGDALRRLAGVPGTTGAWRVTHVLGGDCRCSDEVGKHLVSRRPASDLEERVILLGENSKLLQQMTAVGWQVEVRGPEDFVRDYGTEGTPFFVVNDGADELRYTGGYSKERPGQNARFRDREIIEALRDGKAVAALPVFGCANGKRMRSVTDPLSMKYPRPSPSGAEKL